MFMHIGVGIVTTIMSARLYLPLVTKSTAAWISQAAEDVTQV
jgi:hypothetical protein